MSLNRPHSFKIVKPDEDSRVGANGLVIFHGTKDVYDDPGFVLPHMAVGPDACRPVCVVAGHTAECSSGKNWKAIFHTDHLKLDEQTPASVTLYRILTPGGHAVVLFPAPPRRVQVMPLAGHRSEVSPSSPSPYGGKCKYPSGNVDFVMPADSEEYQFRECPCADGTVTYPATKATKAELYIDNGTSPVQTLYDINLYSGVWAATFDAVSSGTTCTIKVFVNNGTPGTITNPFYNG